MTYNNDYEEKEFNPNPEMEKQFEEMEKQFEEEEMIYRAELEAEKSRHGSPAKII